MKSNILMFVHIVLCLSLLLLSSCANLQIATNESITSSPTSTPSITPSPSLTSKSPAIFTATPFSNKAFLTIQSPSADWIAHVYSPTNLDDPKFTTRIANSNGKTEWVLDYHTVGYEEAYYLPFYWTNDGHYLYLIIFRIRDGCGVLKFYDGSGLFRFDLLTGKLLDLVSEEPSASYTFSISPQESSLIYVQQGEVPITIRVKDVFSGKESTIALEEKYDGSGNFAWFPNDNAVLFVAVENICEDDQNYDLIALDLDTMGMKTIVDNLDRDLTVIEWETPDTVLMSDQQGNTWVLNLKSSQLVLATPTP